MDRFRAECQRCGRCEAICPHRAIRLDAEGLPYIDGLSGWCDLCVECVKVCPTGALSPVDPKLAKLGVASVNRKRCLAWLWGGCRLCYEKCSTLKNAISLDKDYRVYVDSARCNGCGACVNVCPQSSAEGESKNFGRAVSLIVSEDGTQS